MDKGVSVINNENEIIFSHLTGEQSILVRRNIEIDRREFIDMDAPGLVDFYSKFVGASLGGGILMIGSPVHGGLDLSSGYKIPDFIEIRNTALKVDVKPS